MGVSLYKITEEDVYTIMSNVAKRVLKEGIADDEQMITWDKLKEYLGADEMLDKIFEVLTPEEVQELIQRMKENIGEKDEDFYLENDFDED